MAISKASTRWRRIKPAFEKGNWMRNGDLHEKRPVQGCEDNIRQVSVEALLGSDISQFDLHRIEQTMSLMRYRGKLNATAV
ncbi:hypothetical protein [Agrobacterium fabrum]|uniref:hypothetical protein n=1 Tax=Agrobacterium fabrum TaxID=1176649 RepID=UPI00117807D4|nr:hypothetical protein [Agrobacterium fabrum]